MICTAHMSCLNFQHWTFLKTKAYRMGHCLQPRKLTSLLLKMSIINIILIKQLPLKCTYSVECANCNVFIKFTIIIKIHKLYSLYANTKPSKTLMNIKKYQRSISWMILNYF